VLVEVSVQSLRLDHSTETPVVILKERSGERLLPIWIGAPEASAIAVQLAEWEFPRPLTHDLIVSVVGGLGAELEKVVIDRVEESTYYAELVIRRNGKTITVDARPSDSIAIALRFNAQIFAQEELLERISIETTAGGGESVALPDEPQESPEGPEGPTEHLSADELKEYLRKLNPEDFGRFSP